MDFISVSFIVDIEWRSDAWLLFAYNNGADSHTKLQLIVFKFK